MSSASKNSKSVPSQTEPPRGTMASPKTVITMDPVRDGSRLSWLMMRLSAAGCGMRQRIPRFSIASQQAQQKFAGVERKSRKPTDQRAVEADILQVLADVDFDQRNQLRHVPALHLVGDEARYAALLVGDEASEHDDQPLIDLAAQLDIAVERLAGCDKHPGQMMLQHL